MHVNIRTPFLLVYERVSFHSQGCTNTTASYHPTATALFVIGCFHITLIYIHHSINVNACMYIAKRHRAVCFVTYMEITPAPTMILSTPIGHERNRLAFFFFNGVSVTALSRIFLGEFFESVEVSSIPKKANALYYVCIVTLPLQAMLQDKSKQKKRAMQNYSGRFIQKKYRLPCGCRYSLS